MNIRSWSSLSLLALLACGGAQTGPAAGGAGTGPSGTNKPAAAGDVSFEVPPIEIKGVVFEPGALGRPGMPLVSPKKKTTLEKQRETFAKQKDPVQRQAHAAILATLLYDQSKVDKTAEKALLTEARQVLRDAAKSAGAKPDEITLRLLGSYELLVEDYAGAEQAWAQLVAANPKNKDNPYNRAWWALSLMRQGKNAEALAVVKDEPTSDKQPELAYAQAWAKWRTGDHAGAWTAIQIAAKGWGTNANVDILQNDVFLFAGRSDVELGALMQPLFGVFNAKQKGQQYEVLVKLGLQAYNFAGRWADGVAALDKALELAGSTVPANDLPVIRYQQAQMTVPLGKPDHAAQLAKQAIEALPACGAKCSDKDKQDLVYGVYGMGRLFHLLYATANDTRYYQPAYDLYTLTVPLLMDAQRRGDAQKDLATLQQTLKNTRVGTGTHDKTAIPVLLTRHNQEVQACYEVQLTANAKLGGTITTDLVVDQTGTIKGATTEPKPGLEGMSAVAGCITEAAKTWKLPSRGMAGETRIKLVYQLSPRG